MERLEDFFKDLLLLQTHSKQARVEADKCHLLSLSDDVLMIILDHLDGVSLLNLGQTCLRLSNVTADPNLWKVVDLSSVSSSISQLKQRLKHINAKTRSIKIKGTSVILKWA